MIKLNIKHFFILQLFIFTSHAQIKVENDSLLLWNQNRRIEWQDFKAENIINTSSKYAGGSAAINISIGFYPKKISCSNLQKIIIVSQMSKYKSWTAMKTNDEEGLNHEQTHFNIAELFARKIRKSLKEYMEFSSECDLNTIVDIYYELDDKHWKTQYLYDDEVRICEDSSQESCHNLLKQKEWDEKISDSLEAYKDYELTIDIDDLE